MEIKHTHPNYETVQERLDRLRELRKLCVTKLTAARKAAKRTAS